MTQFTAVVRESIGNQAPYWLASETRIRIRECELPANQRQLDEVVAQKVVAKLFGRRLSLRIEHQAPGYIIGYVYRAAPRKSGAALERADVGRLSISIYR